jgi:hypothetical protein
MRPGPEAEVSREQATSALENARQFVAYFENVLGEQLDGSEH